MSPRPTPTVVAGEVLERLHATGVHPDVIQVATSIVHGAEGPEEVRFWKLFALLVQNAPVDAACGEEARRMATAAIHVAPTRFNSPAWNRQNVAPACWVCCVLAILLAQVPGYTDASDPVHAELVDVLVELLTLTEDGIEPVSFAPDPEGLDEAVEVVRAVLASGVLQGIPTTRRILTDAVGRIAAAPPRKAPPRRQPETKSNTPPQAHAASPPSFLDLLKDAAVETGSRAVTSLLQGAIKRA